MRILAVWLLALGSAYADDLAKAREHYKAASRAYEIGAYDEAIREYGEAYRLKDDPAILYNMAQAHRLAEHAVESLRLYRMYLMKVPNAENRVEVQNKIDTLQKLIDEQRRAKNLSPDTPLPPPKVVAPPPKVVTAPPPKVVTAPPKVVEPPPKVVEPPPPKILEPAVVVSSPIRDEKPARKRWVIPVAVVAAVAVVGIAVGLGAGLGAGGKTVDPAPSLTPVRWK